MTIGIPGGHLFVRHTFRLPSFHLFSVISDLIGNLFFYLDFSSVILSERSESKDLLKDIRPATTREAEYKGDASLVRSGAGVLGRSSSLSGKLFSEVHPAAQR